MKSLLPILLFLGMAAYGCQGQSQTQTQTQSQTPHPYFPLQSGSVYHYQYVFKDQSGLYSLAVKDTQINDIQQLFYFQEIKEEREDAVEDARIIGSTMFGLGGYVLRRGEIWTIQVFWKGDLEEIQLNQRQLLLPSDLEEEKEWKTESYEGESTEIFSYEGTETMVVPAGRFEDCVKIKIQNIWENEESVDEFIWLKEGVGMVKRIRGTGRVEELKEYSLK